MHDFIWRLNEGSWSTRMPYWQSEKRVNIKQISNHDQFWLTFLNNSRDSEILPKHFRRTGCCVTQMIVGNSRLISNGMEYQFNCSILRKTSLYASLTRSPSSDTMNTAQEPYNAANNVRNNVIESTEIQNRRRIYAKIQIIFSKKCH